MDILILALFILAVFLIVTLLLVKVLVDIYGDSSASYKLFAVRDELIHAVVFDDLNRNDPYFSELYGSVNNILTHSNFISGPAGWFFAPKVGKYLAENPEQGESINPLPKEGHPPVQLVKVLDDIYDALTYLLENHNGFFLQISAHISAVRRKERRLQKEKAKQLRDMVDNFRHSASAT